ncbi:MAG: hypothetical protein AABX17_01140 [Nanoarchaeota archaeon]
MQKRITLSVDSKIYADFQKACEGQDIVVSKRVERLMNEETELINRTKRGKITKNETKT